MVKLTKNDKSYPSTFCNGCSCNSSGDIYSIYFGPGTSGNVSFLCSKCIKELKKEILTCDIEEDIED